MILLRIRSLVQYVEQRNPLTFIYSLINLFKTCGCLIWFQLTLYKTIVPFYLNASGVLIQLEFQQPYCIMVPYVFHIKNYYLFRSRFYFKSTSDIMLLQDQIGKANKVKIFCKGKMTYYMAKYCLCFYFHNVGLPYLLLSVVNWSI